MLLNMERLVDKGYLSYEVAKNLRWRCRCGWAILQNETGTIRKCSNPYCPIHMSHRADYMFKDLGYADIGPKTAEAYIRKFNLKSHFDLLNPDLYYQDFSDKGQLMRKYAQMTRRVHLYKIAEYAAIPTIGPVQAKEVFNSYKSFDEYFLTNRYCAEYKDMLISAQKYFILEAPMAKQSIKVMATGKINGFSKRSHFFDYCNRIYGHRIFCDYSESKIKSADFLVRDNMAQNTPKVELARREGMRIYTSREFLVLLEHNFGENSTIYNQNERREDGC